MEEEIKKTSQDTELENNDLKELVKSLTKEMKEIKSSVNSLWRTREADKAKEFDKKYPDGMVYGGKYPVYNYTSYGKLQSVLLPKLDEALIGYKVNIINDITYIMLRTEKSERLFLLEIDSLDSYKSNVIEIINKDIDYIKNQSWKEVE